MIYLLPHLLSNSAKKYPSHPAVVFNETSFSYAELEELTNKLANTLLEAGIKRGDRIGIYLNKSINSIVAILGILKAGAVYVPIDPNSPEMRIRYIINNCGIQCLLTSQIKFEKLKTFFPVDCPLSLIVILDAEQKIESSFSSTIISQSEIQKNKHSECPSISTIETDLAYILYTSGSTGVPKGVMISHLNSLTFINWAYDYVGVKNEDRLSNHAPMHFDLSIFDIFVSLKAGATLIIVPEGLSTFPIRLAEWIEKNQISIWYSVPSILSMLVNHGELKRFSYSKLHTIIFAGEVFPIKYLRKLMGLIPHPRYLNFYGPTETNVITAYEVAELANNRTQPVPIGKTCANMEVFALNDKGKIIKKPGEVGELIARGSCVAQGYWGDVEKTEKSFKPNPVQQNFRDQVYYTGDLVTLDSDRNFIFVGRRDHMIKSRGYRIELGEIETVLYSHPEVKEAAVIPIPDEIVGNRIKAFIVRKNGNLNSTSIQEFCAQRLVRYMVPEMIEFRTILPKTSTGKIDKQSLLTKK